ncbi:MAG: HdeD family acid-resistance protein [Streptosporangiaceae bacterium]
MTDPHTNRPESGQAGRIAQEHPPGDQHMIPQQKARQEDGPSAQGTRPSDTPMAARPGQPYAASAGGLGTVAARMAWPAALAGALGMLAVGIMLLVWPSATLVVVALLVGASLLAAGVIRLYDGIMDRGASGGMRAADVVIGLLAILAGLYCIRHHALTVLVLAIVVGLFWIVHGVGDLTTAATQGSVPDRGLRVVTGVFSLVAGLFILIWPGISLALFLTIVAAWLLFYGVALAVMAVRLRSAEKAGGSGRMPRATARA